MKKKLKKWMAGILVAVLTVTSLYVPSFKSSAQFVAETAKLGRQAATEGIVMLENREDVLPFDAGDTVAVFGRCQVDTFFCGYGSGSAPGGPYKSVSIMDGIRNNPTIRYNKELAEKYSTWCAENVPSQGSWGNWPYYYPEMPMTEDEVAEASAGSDIAMVVIGRAAGEDRECVLREGSYYLTADEKALLSKVDRHFDKVVILLNVGNLIDMAWLDEYQNIKSVLYVWQGGLDMGNAVADVLSGDVTPSGKLADTIAKTYADYPASSTFASNDGNTGVEIYTEDIYVGYRYFETFAKDRVMYPFGYGLSYTTFDTEARVEADHENITVTATVTNTGNTYSGKEVVQVYYASPQGQLGKPARALAGYVKTNEIAPGASQTVKVSFPVANMASYDDSGKTGHDSAWVLEAGDYDIYVGNSVRAAKKAGTYTVSELTVTEQLEEASAPHQSFERILPVENGDGTFTESTELVPVASEEADLASRVLANLPEAVEMTGDQGIQLIDVYNGTHSMDEFVAQLTVEELAALSRADWAQGSQLTPAKSNAGSFGGMLESLRDKGIPAVSTHDGPAGPRVGTTGTGLPIGTMLACTWNDDLIEKLCYNSGCEMTTSLADVWLAPGMNIHRDPLGGRNFEYFSEDPLLTGQMGAAATRGAQKAGVSVMPKHYAVNSQETNRHNSDSVVSERAQREIYLKGFEICVKTAKPYNVMASYNKINGEWSHYNYDTATTILRGDWGYQGALHTDWWLRQDTSEELGGVSNNAYRIRAQVDVNEPGEGPHYENGSLARTDTATVAAYQTWVDAGSPTDRLVGLTLGELQRTARNVLNAVMNSRVFRATNDLENTYEPGNSWFATEGVLEETKPLLDELTIEGMDFDAFEPSKMLYEVFWKDMNSDFPEVSAKASGGQVTIVQASAEVPAATITVNRDGGKSIYRVIFTNEAGLEPVVKNPVLAKVTGIRVDGKELTAFYPAIYSYSVQGNVDTSEITADVPSGVTYTVTRDTGSNKAVIRAESSDQAVEYVLKFPDPMPKYPVSDDFEDGVLDESIWKVLRPTANLSEGGGTLNIQTEQGEWYGTGSGKNTMNNVVYQEADGNWEATVKLIIPNPAGLSKKDTNQFGIAVYEDPDNYTDMNYCTASWRTDGQFLQVRQETGGTCKDNISYADAFKDMMLLPTTEAWSDRENVTLWMRVIRQDSTYTFQVKTETMAEAGKDFATLGVASAEYETPKLGLYASRGNGNAATSLVKFDDFQIRTEDSGPQSDSFESTELSSFWTVDKRTDQLSVSGGSLNIQTESGEWYGSNEDSWPIRNMPYQNAKGNWTATVEMVIPSPADLLGKNTNQFGMTVFEDSDNYVDINYVTASWAQYGQFLQVRKETDGACNDGIGNSQTIRNLPGTEGWSGRDQVTIWLRVKKNGASYTFSVQTDTMKEAGQDFAVFGETEAYFDHPKIGLFATLGKSAATSLVRFNDFLISDYEAVPEEEKPVKDPVVISAAGESKVMAVEDARLLSSRLKAETCSDTETGGGKDLGHGNNGDYAVYAIQVQDAGYYKVSTRVASGLTNELAQLRHEVEVDGETAADYVHTTTGGWQNWINTDSRNVYLTAGRHTVRFVYGAQINFNFIRFVPCTQEEADAQAVADAKAVIEGCTARQLKVNQQEANTVEGMQNWLAGRISEMLAKKESLNQYGIQVQAADVRVSADSFQPAVAGTGENPQGVDGSYKFTVTLSRGTGSAVTEMRSGTIQASVYEVPETPDTAEVIDYCFRIDKEGTIRLEAEDVDVTNYVISGNNPTKIVEREDASGGAFLAAATGAISASQYFEFRFTLAMNAEIVMSASYAQTEQRKGVAQEMAKSYTYLLDENKTVGLSSNYVLQPREDITRWDTVTYDKFTLPAGEHTVKVRVAENTGNGNPNIDYIDFQVKKIEGELPEESAVGANDIHTGLQYNYLNDEDIENVYAYANGVLELSRPKAIVCDFSEDEGIAQSSSYVIQKSETADFADPVTVTGLTEKKYGFYNLKLGEHFYWRGGSSLDTIADSPVHEMTLNDQGPRNCYVDGVTNVRDIGGYVSSLTENGKIRQGIYYRGASLNEITENGKAQLKDQLGARVEIDLRDSGLCQGPYVDGVEYHAISIPSGTEPTRFEEFASEYRQIFALIANADEKPVYLHCTAGADRTGIVTFMLLTVCGADYKDIARDYLFTNFSTHGARYLNSEFNNWWNKLDRFQGETKAEKAKNWMISKGIPGAQVEKIREIFVEGYTAADDTEADSEAIRSLLQVTLDAYKELNTDAYTKETADVLTAALENAEQVLADSMASDTDVILAAKEILKAGAGLIPDTSGLENAVAAAQAAADTAQATANAAQTAAGAAQTAADAARTAADQAQTTADQAQAAAEEAKAAADKAQAELDAAKQDIDTRKDKLEERETAASAAKTKAEEAAAAAAAAGTKAEEAAAAAAKAQTTADEAKTAAAEAKAAAEAAKTAAVTEAKRALLSVTLHAYKELNTDTYTAESAAKLSEALEAGQKVFDDASSTDAQILAAATGILSAAASLVPDTASSQKELQEAKDAAEEAWKTVEEIKAVYEDSKKQETPAEGTEEPDPAEGQSYDRGDYTYRILSNTDRKVEITGLKNTDLTRISVYSSVILGGKSYKVAAVAPAAFKNNRKVTSVTIAKNVETIGQEAFAGCTSLKKVTINSTALKEIGSKAFSGDKKLKSIVIRSRILKKAGKNAFKGIYKKAVIRVPSSKVKAYTKLLRNKGQSSSVKIRK